MSKSLLFRPGALSSEQILDIRQKGILRNVDPDNVDGSAFDLTLSNECYRLPYAIKPRKQESCQTVLKDEFRYNPNSNGEFELKREDEEGKRYAYVFKVKQEINFRGYGNFWGMATGKSSLGRIDLLVRLVANDADCYDFVRNTQSGDPIYVEIIPITFDVIVKEGVPISQLRLFMGHPDLNKIPLEELEKTYKEDLLRDEEGKIPKEFSNRLTVNLHADATLKGKPCAFRAKGNTDPINLAKLEEELKKEKVTRVYKPKLLDPKDYWEPLCPDRESLLLERERFHILRSCERLYLPEYVAVGCEAVKEELGELRVHYAGFAHPGFGRRKRKDDKGTPLIFEVRGHNFNTRLRHGEALATIEFFCMSKSIDLDKDKGSAYDKQELQLSKYFKDWK